MWVCSKETSDAFVYKEDIEREPHLYPEGLVEALRKIRELESFNTGSSLDPSFRFAFEGFIVQDDGIVGLHPSASELAKKEWMNFWKANKAAPLALF